MKTTTQIAGINRIEYEGKDTQSYLVAMEPFILTAAQLKELIDMAEDSTLIEIEFKKPTAEARYE